MKLTYEQKREIAEKLAESQIEDETTEYDDISLKDIKAIYKSEINDNGDLDYVEKQKNRSIKRKMIKDERSKNKVIISWNISVGDAVQFTNWRTGEEEIGIVVKQNSDGKYKNAAQAKMSGRVLVLSSSGQNWFLPKSLEKIEDN